MEHNFKALQTFRGWSHEYNKWVYGGLIVPNELKYIAFIFIVGEHGLIHLTYAVHKDSIGIYTGKDDSEGTPIFAGLPEKGNLGGDNVTAWLRDNKSEKLNGFVCYEYGEFMIEQDDDSFPLCTFSVIDESSFVVTSSQWEQYLKEKGK